MLDRRRFLATFSGMGLSSTLLPGVLWALADGKTEITEAMIEQAAAIADVPIPAEYHKTMLESLNDHAKNFEEIYKLHIPNSVAPALVSSITKVSCSTCLGVAVTLICARPRSSPCG